jgi:hypothetical protein
MLTRQEILDYAARYLTPGEDAKFPFNGDLFCLLGRELPEGKILADEEGWLFHGYGICSGYLLDDEAKPPGRWLWMHFVSLAAFPPASQVLKLQPPHVVKGRFQNPDRTREFRILNIRLGIGPEGENGIFMQPSGPSPEPRATLLNESVEKKIVRFRRKNSGKPSDV